MKEAILGIILGAHKIWLESWGKEGFRANLRNANLHKADLRNVDFANVNLHKADLSYADFRYADFDNADFDNADLRHADLRHADFDNANLDNADLSNADLRNANLRNANLRNADFDNSNLHDVDLSNADLRYIANGNDGEILTLQLGEWQTVITKDIIAIGCRQHSVAEWFDFNDSEIDDMDENALQWWTENREVIKQVWQKNFG